MTDSSLLATALPGECPVPTNFVRILPVDDGIVVTMRYVYILRCADDSLYIGETDDLTARLARHNDGRGCVFTASRLPDTLAHSEEYPTRNDALKRERQLKRWTRAKKEALIAGELGLLKRL